MRKNASGQSTALHLDGVLAELCVDNSASGQSISRVLSNRRVSPEGDTRTCMGSHLSRRTVASPLKQPTRNFYPAGYLYPGGY